jgi:diguanylate cyclase (GGDEF)-like protein
MNMPVYFINTSFFSCLVTVLVAVDYIKKFNTDEFQRRIFLAVLVCTFIAVLADFSNRAIGGIPGQFVKTAIYALVVVFYLAQNAAYYFVVVFLNYVVRKDAAAAKKGIIAVTIFLSVYFVFTVLTLPASFFFYVSDTNHFEHGHFYAVRLIISYASVLLIIVNLIISYTYYMRSQITMMILFCVLNAGGATIDVVIKNSSLMWPCFCGSLLYVYFFIIQTDTRIDSLTGVGNRAAFNDFILNLSRQTARHSYLIAMIDMNDFKMINDNFGHSMGDRALIEMAQIIKDCIRSSDFTARYGGDEFVIAIRADHDMARLMERIEESIAKRNEINDLPYRLSISYGYDCFTTHSMQNIDEFLKHIDRLMYEHKARQKGVSARPSY